MEDNPSRRRFIEKISLSTLGVLVGGKLVYGDHMPEGYVPLVLEDQDPYQLFGKHPDMVLLNDRPWNMEAQAHLLDDRITPSEKMFIRNNGLIPENIVPNDWMLTIEGESAKEIKQYSIRDLKSRFQAHTYQLTIECGGNGRSEFDPPAKGNQWTIGAISCAEWTGVRLRDLLEDVGVKGDAQYVGYYGADVHLSGDRSKAPISRGIPLSKAMMDETIVAYAMNGKDIPIAHGHPLRLIAGGFPGSASGKWLNKLVIRNRIHDGEKMAAPSYRVPCKPVAPGEKVANEDMCIIEEMPVKSLITYPKSGAMLKPGQKLNIRGHAWTGYGEITKVEYSIDFGATWKIAQLELPTNPFAWQHFSAQLTFPDTGYYEVWAAATDTKGNRQPMLVPGWNPKGYLNNACHRIAVKVLEK
jgi:sulfite oxidase